VHPPAQLLRPLSAEPWRSWPKVPLASLRHPRSQRPFESSPSAGTFLRSIDESSY
jgi:hypothetical protein